MGIRKTNRRRSSAFHNINVTPLVDVLLVLLIIFMITAQTMHNDVEINLPRASTSKASKNQNQNNLTIFINAKKEIIIGNERVDNLETYLTSLSNKSKEDQIIIVGDSSVPYQRLIEVLVSLNNVGFSKIKMAYDKK